MDNLNEAIACYIEELEETQRNKDLTIAEKVRVLHSISEMMSREKDYAYGEK
jgi:hypothetical protein